MRRKQRRARKAAECLPDDSWFRYGAPQGLADWNSAAITRLSVT